MATIEKYAPVMDQILTSIYQHQEVETEGLLASEIAVGRCCWMIITLYVHHLLQEIGNLSIQNNYWTRYPLKTQLCVLENRNEKKGSIGSLKSQLGKILKVVIVSTQFESTKERKC